MHACSSWASNRLLGSGAEQGRLRGGLGGRLRRTRWQFTVLTGQFLPPAAVERVEGLGHDVHGAQAAVRACFRRPAHLRHVPFAMAKTLWGRIEKSTVPLPSFSPQWATVISEPSIWPVFTPIGTKTPPLEAFQGGVSRSKPGGRHRPDLNFCPGPVRPRRCGRDGRPGVPGPVAGPRRRGRRETEACDPVRGIPGMALSTVVFVVEEAPNGRGRDGDKWAAGVPGRGRSAGFRAAWVSAARDAAGSGLPGTMGIRHDADGAPEGVAEGDHLGMWAVACG